MASRNDIERMKMSIRIHMDENPQGEWTFEELFYALANPESRSPYYFTSALEEMEHAGELNRDRETYIKRS